MPINTRFVDKPQVKRRRQFPSMPTPQEKVFETNSDAPKKWK
jgi:hypothetical protein